MNEGPPRPLACCRVCGAPLIATLAFRKYEFYCLECGRHYDFLAPSGRQPTPELKARYQALLEEWNEHAGKLIVDGGNYSDCETCTSSREPHELHATDDERAAHDAAIAWLRERATRHAVGAPAAK
jgi:hypothetical protein